MKNIRRDARTSLEIMARNHGSAGVARVEYDLERLPVRIDRSRGRTDAVRARVFRVEEARFRQVFPDEYVLAARRFDASVPVALAAVACRGRDIRDDSDSSSVIAG